MSAGAIVTNSLAAGSCSPFSWGLEDSGGPDAPRSGAQGLPCLSSNNCTGVPDEPAKAWDFELHKLQPNHKKTAHLLAETIADLAGKYGVERLGFLTLTFAEHVTDPKQAQARWHSLKTHVLNKRYLHWVRAFERMISGRIHYHVVVVLPADIRTGVSFPEFAEGDYRSASPALRREWAFWRETAPAYRFGRTELLPVKSTAEGIARYVGKYVSKHIGARKIEDKGVRLVEFSRGSRIGTTAFAWNTPAAWVWRQKLKQFAGSVGCKSMDELSARFGPRWAYGLRESIMGVRLEFYPTSAHAAADGVSLEGFPADAIDIRISRQAQPLKIERTGRSPVWPSSQDGISQIPIEPDASGPGDGSSGIVVGRRKGSA